MKHSQRIFAFHLLNDRSGSPKVLSQIINGWVKSGNQVALYTSLHQDGFLSQLPGVRYYSGWYRFRANPWLRLLFFTLSQLLLVLKMFREIKKNDLIYINTVLPFGAAILGKMKGARVVYHIHESTIQPAILRWFLLKMVAYTASDIINVSAYVRQSHGITSVPNHLIYNAIDETFMAALLPKEKVVQPSHVLMVCSLKAYKGIFEYVQLANDQPQLQFKLVLNAQWHEVTSFFQDQTLPGNLTLYPSQKNLHPFFQWADLIVNLSRADGWVETFGLTIIEGMAYGLPALVPEVGGILEVIEEGLTGYSVDSRNRDQLNAALQQALHSPAHYHIMSKAAAARLSLFRENQLLNSINAVVACR